jgi:hypothetical protein
VTELPAVYVLYDSSFWSGAVLLGIFSVSVWNGGGFYIEVFGRKYVHFQIAIRTPFSCHEFLQVRARIRSVA